MWKVTLKGLWGRKFRALLTGLAVLLGVAFMAGTLVLTDTVGKAFDELFADINAGTDAVVRRTADVDSEFGPDIRPRVPDDIVADILAVDGVADAEGDVGGFAVIFDRQGEPVGFSDTGPPTLGFNWQEVDELNPLVLADGDPPSAPDEVVIDKATADAEEFAIGDTLEIFTQSGLAEYTLTGIVKFGTADSPLGATVAAWESSTAQRLLAAPDEWNAIRVVAEEGVSQEELRERIAGGIAAGIGGRADIEVLTGDELTEENESDIEESLGFFNTFLLVFAGIALFVGSFIIFNTLSIVVAQRTRELALLRAVGASRRQVLSSVLGEAIVVALVASALGLFAGILLAAGLIALLKAAGIDLPTTTLVVSPGTVVAALVVGSIVTLAAAVVPARRASRVPPLAALRDVEVDVSGRSWRRSLSGGIVLVAGMIFLGRGLFAEVDNRIQQVGLGAALVFLGVAILGPIYAEPLSRFIGSPLPRLRGITGQIARENARRNPRRTASTAAALMIGVGIIGFIAITASSIKASIDEVIGRAFRADFVIDSGSFGFGGLSPDVAETVREIDGVEAASPLRFGEVNFQGSAEFVDAVDPESIDLLFDVGVSEGSFEGMRDDQIAMYRVRAEEEGLAIGDEVRLEFSETGSQPFTIAALFDEPEPADDFVITLGAFEDNFADVFDSQLYVKFESGTDLDAARVELEDVVGDLAPQAQVQDQNDFREEITAQIDGLLNFIYALLLFAVIIALLGIANALALAVYERTREIGLLRAVGMSRGQVRSAVRWESVIIALLGTLVGLAISVLFGWALVEALSDEGIEVFDIPVAQMVAIVVLSAVAGVVAGILPARRAARLDVLHAISHE
jgi:putative ABC transport system permease protein